ncbi:MAG: hypothetical protein ACI89X_000525 [Planctomycetota bacterium]|jgi:hypothetical protein
MKSLILSRARDVIGALLLASLMGACAHRSVTTTEGALPFGADVKKIRIEMTNGTLDLATILAGASQNEVVWQGGIRRDAGSAEELTTIEKVAINLSGAMDPKEPGTFVVTCPTAPAGVIGMIAYEGNIRVPASLPLEVVVTDNGHVTMAGREAFSKVNTRRGDLRFQGCKGGIEANTGQGNVIAYDHEDNLDVRTGLGDMQVFIVKPGKQVTLSTGQGTVQCYVPEDTEFEVDARAEIGRIGNDFDIEVRKVGEYSAAMAGVHISPETRVILRTASGHISLIRRKPE